MIPARLVPLCAILLFALISCDQSNQNDQITVDHSQFDLRKPAVPPDYDHHSYPSPQQSHTESNESSLILEEILNRPATEVIAKHSPAILASVLEAFANQSGSGVGTNPVESLGPEILGAILQHKDDIPPELVDEAKAAIGKYAPAVIEEILSQSETDNHVADTIGSMILRKLLESKGE